MDALVKLYKTFIHKNHSGLGITINDHNLPQHTKIILMKYLLVIGLLFCQGCSMNSYTSFDYNKSENPWIDAFKDRVFFSALQEAYKSDSLIFNSINKKDALNLFDGLSLEEIENANNIGINLTKKIPPPSMCENCPDGMNYYMATALHYYKSKELNNIARNNFKKHEDNNKKNGLKNN